MKVTPPLIPALQILMFLALAVAPAPCRGADGDPKAAVAAALRRLADQPNFTWQTTVQIGSGPVRGFRAAPLPGTQPASGEYEAGGYTSVTQSNLQFVLKGNKAAVLVDDCWMTLEQAAARTGGDRGPGGPGGFNPALITNFKLPVTQAEEYLSKASDFKAEGDAVTA